MIDFAALQGLTIPEGVVTQIAKDGVVLWSAAKDLPIILEVAKVTSDTYANETTYTSEEFVLLDIYPKSSTSTVTVTYGGLTKTLTFSGTNAQQVFFGTFNGTSDSVSTPASGTLTIEGGCKTFAAGTYKKYNTITSKSSTKYCNCITDVVDWGSVTSIVSYAFYGCTGITISSLPSGVTSIGSSAFYGCTGITISSLPSGVTSIAASVFAECISIKSMILHSGITSIGSSFCVYVNEATGWSSLDTLTLLATTPPTLADGALGSTSSSGTGIKLPKIIVPAGCGDTYKAAEYWSEYADYITEAS